MSHGSVATQLRCGEIFYNHHITNCAKRMWQSKNCENRSTFGESM